MSEFYLSPVWLKKLLPGHLPADMFLRIMNLGTVLADQTQIHQVLMNLCTNAAHAMEVRGGMLTVTLKNCIVDENTAANGDDLSSGRYLQLSVRGTGSGMDKAVVDRIFDPYYTTKAVGEGTGVVIGHPRTFNETGHCPGTLPNHP